MNSRVLLVSTLLLALFCSCNAQYVSVESLTAYNKWSTLHPRIHLNDAEKIYRQSVFFEKFQKVKEHNSNSSHTYTIGLNQFSDMTDVEFVEKILSSDIHSAAPLSAQTNPSTTSTPTTAGLAATVDWRTQGAVTPVKDQGQCGSCWSFSATGVMEGFNFIHNKVLTSFSEQQYVDCTNATNGYISKGCSGGIPYEAVSYASKVGAETETAYPYTAVTGSTCKVSGTNNGYKPKTFGYITQNNASVFQSALNASPVSVLVDASTWSSYHSGVYNGCSATPTFNHAVLVVGYDANGNWIVKNSWNTWWGMSGYITLQAGNTCGVLTYPLIIVA